jgi:hypothetical protein
VIFRSSSLPLWLRLVGLIIGASLFIWIPYEDQGVLWVLFLSVTICGWLAIRFLLNSTAPSWKMVAWHSLVGGVAGLSIVPLALLLMILKSGLHGHSTPDFTIEQIQSVIRLMPLASLSGSMIGLGCGLYRSVR